VPDALGQRGAQPRMCLRSRGGTSGAQAIGVPTMSSEVEPSRPARWRAVPLVLVLGACTTTELSTSESALWTAGGSSTTVEWNSGETNHLSVWEVISCRGDYGTNYMLTSLTGWREPSSNADNFIARLRAGCTEYVPYNGDDLEQDDATEVTELLYEGNYRSTSGTTEIVVDRDFPGQLMLNLDSAGDYVRDVALVGVRKSSLGDFLEPTTTFTDFAMGLGVRPHPVGVGNYETLSCPSQYVITGLSMRYDVSKGKIRRLKITCSTLLHS
jgi:hypothetical protein